VVIGVVALLVLSLVDRNRIRPRVTAPPVPHGFDPQTGQVQPLVPASTTAPFPAPAPWPAPQPVQASRPSKRRGPILFWFTMALAALGVGVLGIADLAGAHVLPSAYPALVVGACGLMVLVGAFYGRPGGLVFVGLVASLAMLIASAVGPWHGAGHRPYNPEQAASVQDSYRLSAGELVLNLTGVQDLQALDGRTIHLTARTGRIEVVLPSGVDAHVVARVTGAGHITLWGNEWDGVRAHGTAHHTAVAGSPQITIDATLLAGEIDVHTKTTGVTR
jgi:hypothetical protein